ncbi:hypothetical protein K438DRAFT_1939206 [Mycena galopus ATCC 62051]|nr:hypothetical protein K438DRAFT_1939206 [Mycena galopus ATCC 62051]
MGGLDDDAAAATRPTSTKVGDTTRKNLMVAIDLVGSSDHETPSRIADNPVKSRARKSRAKIESTGPRLAALNVKTTPKVKGEPGTAVKAESSSTFNFTPPSHADVNNLPAFMASTWASKFLQGAYLALSKAPKAMTFATAADASVTVAALQEVLDELYPGCGWKITWSDAICTKAVAHIGERRGAFGRSGIAAVDEKFKSIKYFGSLDGPEAGLRLLPKIQADAKYALRFNGPALFRVPTPEDHALDSKDPDYVKPIGFLESRPFIAAVKPFIKTGNFKIVRTQSDKVDLTASVLPFGVFVMGAVSPPRILIFVRSRERTAPHQTFDKNLVILYKTSQDPTRLQDTAKVLQDRKTAKLEMILTRSLVRLWLGALIVKIEKLVGITRLS